MEIGTRIRVKDWEEQTNAEGVIVNYGKFFYFVDLDEWEPVDGPIPHWLFLEDEIEPV